MDEEDDMIIYLGTVKASKREMESKEFRRGFEVGANATLEVMFQIVGDEPFMKITVSWEDGTPVMTGLEVGGE